MSRIIEKMYRGSKYTEALIDPGTLIKYLLRLEGISSIYRRREVVDNVKKIIEDIEDLRLKELLDIPIRKPANGLYKSGYKFIVSRDLVGIVKEFITDNMYITDKYPNMLMPIKYEILPICDQCSKDIYAEITSLRQAYIEDQYRVESFYPEKIYVDNVAIEKNDLYRCGTLNFEGYKFTQDYNDLPPCRDLLRKLTYAIL
jgi:hypothetical protein